MVLRDLIGADVATIFTAGGFTVTATHNYNGGASNEDLEVLFDAPYDSVLGEDRELESARPQMLLPRANAGNIASDSNFTINSILYYIIETRDTANDDIIQYILSEDTRNQ